MSLAILVWITQGALMFFDEFYFHYRRPLERWERIGHPLDTFLFLCVFIFTLFANFSNEHHVTIFLILSILSCLIITKDEWVHTHLCCASENWLHAVLFVIHPISLIVLYGLWKDNNLFWIKVQSLIILLFLLYQIIFWNFIAPLKETYETQRK